MTPATAAAPNRATEPIRVGIFPDVAAADQVVEELLKSGYTRDHISVVCSNEHKRHQLERDEGIETEKPGGERTPGAVSSGTAIGGAIGAIGGFVTAATAVASGVSLLVAGPMLALAAAGGVVVGGLVNAMRTRGVETGEAQFYEHAVRRGKVLVAVEVGEHSTGGAVDDVFARFGAEPLEMTKG